MFLLCNSLPSTTPRHTSINTIHCHATRTCLLNPQTPPPSVSTHRGPKAIDHNFPPFLGIRRLWYPPPSPTLVSFYQFYDMALTPPTQCLRRRCPPSSSLLDSNCIMRILMTVAFAMTTTTVFSLPNGDGDGALLSPFPPPSPTEILC